MKFNPENLLEIYLNGSFTEEAQAEFDALMRKDPDFAERVTKAVAERVGAVPDSMVDQVSGRLDGKIDAVWQKYKPSPARRMMKRTVQLAVLIAATGGLYTGYKHFGPGSPTATDAGTAASSSDGALSTRALEGGPVNGNSTTAQVNSSENSSAGKNSNTNAGSPAGSKKLSLDDKQRRVSPMGLKGLPAADNSIKPKSVVSSNGGAGGEIPAEGASPKNHGPTIMSVPQTEEGDTLRVSIETQKAQSVIVTVLDPNGLLVRHLYQGVWSAGVHLVDWDGKDETGNPVTPGNYTVVVNTDGKTMSGTVTVQPNR